MEEYAICRLNLRDLDEEGCRRLTRIETRGDKEVGGRAAIGLASRPHRSSPQCDLVCGDFYYYLLPDKYYFAYFLVTEKGYLILRQNNKI
jgi:hypothetical protein